MKQYLSLSAWGSYVGENRVHIMLGCRESQAAASSEGAPPPPSQKDLWKEPRHSELHHRADCPYTDTELQLLTLPQSGPAPTHSKPPDSVMSRINSSYVSRQPVSLSPCSTGSSLHPSSSIPPQRSPGFPTKAHEICTKMTHPDGWAHRFTQTTFSASYTQLPHCKYCLPILRRQVGNLDGAG